MSTELPLENFDKNFTNSQALSINGIDIAVDSDEIQTINYAEELLGPRDGERVIQPEFRIKVKRVSELEISQMREAIEKQCLFSPVYGLKVFIGQKGKYFVSPHGYITFQPYDSEIVEIYSTIPSASISCMIRKFLIDRYSSKGLHPQYFHGNAINDIENKRTIIFASSGGIGSGSRRGKTTISLALAADKQLKYSYLSNDDIVITPKSLELLPLPAEVAIRSRTIEYLSQNGTQLQVKPEFYMDKQERVHLATNKDLRNSDIRTSDTNYEQLDWFDIDLNIENKYSLNELSDDDAMILLQKSVRKRRLAQSLTPLLISEEITTAILKEVDSTFPTSVEASFERIKNSGGKFYRLQGGYNQEQIHQLLDETNGN